VTAKADTDDELIEEPPRIRPWRMILGGVFGVGGTVMALLSWSFLRGPRTEPQGSAAAIGQGYASMMSWGTLFVGALIAVVATTAFVLALLEARAARARP